jgi:hypothetical protein
MILKVLVGNAPNKLALVHCYPVLLCALSVYIPN